MNDAPVCIVGAGSSGVTCAKALLERGVAFDCFEKGSALGGMWRYENDNGMSCAYRSLHIDTSRRNLGYSDHPIPAHLPDFMSHEDVLVYLENYADRFGVRPHVTFGTAVTDVAPTGDGHWNVTLSTGETRRYRAVIVGNGHLWDPRWPDFPGRLDGLVMHSQHYRVADPFEGRHVLVVGIGNSAVDIAVDVCRRAKSVTLSTRRGAWIMPKYIMGIPTDRWSAFLGRRLKLPTPVVRMIVQRLMRIAVGDQSRYGMPKPAHPMWREHATLSQELLPYMGHGWIRVKPDVRELKGNAVEFVDGTSAPIDAIVYATGYRMSFPFLKPDVFEAKDGAVSLYRRMLDPDRPGLYFAGLVQPVGPNIPLVEIQGRWLADALSGAMALPDRATMDREIAKHRETLERRYVKSARYTLEVDFNDYAKQMRGDMKRRLAGA